MADAVCGPSNPLQSLQKHATGLLPHQQDRLRVHATPGQGFRSADPRAGVLDADFAAFESGHSFEPHAQAPWTFSTGPSHFRPATTPSPDVTNSWASDFQKLRLTGPGRPIPQSQFRQEAPLHRSQPAVSGWHAEFIRQQQSKESSSTASSQQNFNPSPYAFSNRMPITFDGYASSQFTPSPPVQDFAQISQQNQPMVDDAAFEDAFAQAESEQLNAESQVAAEKDTLENLADDSDIIRIGSDLIPERSSPTTEQQEKAEADDLARTAGDLLNALKHDQSEKFKQSQFLTLMRRIRDREVEVKGDDLREKNSSPGELRDHADSYQPLHPGGRYYPEQSPTRLPARNLIDEFDIVPESASLAQRFGLQNKILGYQTHEIAADMERLHNPQEPGLQM